jgi:hypothetical protein
MSIFTNRDEIAEQAYKKTEEAAASYPRDWSGLDKPPKDPWFASKFQYYDSIVKNSNEFPNMFHIQPYDMEIVPSTPSQAIFDSIQKNKKFFYAGTYMDVVRNDIWA